MSALLRRWHACLLFLVAAAVAFNVQAATPEHIASELPKARMAGSGTFRYFGLEIYDATLWVGPNGYRPAASTIEKFALDLRYARTFQGKRIAARSTDEMEKLKLGSVAQRAEWNGRMTALFPDVVEGTHITGVYLPKEGARFYSDGKLLGDILDPEFGQAFFAIWLDPKTTGGPLRDALLANAAPR